LYCCKKSFRWSLFSIKKRLLFFVLSFSLQSGLKLKPFLQLFFNLKCLLKVFFYLFQIKKVLKLEVKKQNKKKTYTFANKQNPKWQRI